MSAPTQKGLETLPLMIRFAVFHTPRTYGGPDAHGLLSADLISARVHGVAPSAMTSLCKAKPNGLTFEDISMTLSEGREIPENTPILVWQKL